MYTKMSPFTGNQVTLYIVLPQAHELYYIELVHSDRDRVVQLVRGIRMSITRFLFHVHHPKAMSQVPKILFQNKEGFTVYKK